MEIRFLQARIASRTYLSRTGFVRFRQTWISSPPKRGISDLLTALSHCVLLSALTYALSPTPHPLITHHTVDAGHKFWLVCTCTSPCSPCSPCSCAEDSSLPQRSGGGPKPPLSIPFSVPVCAYIDSLVELCHGYLFISLSLYLSISLSLYAMVIIYPIEWCVGEPQSSPIVSYNIQFH